MASMMTRREVGHRVAGGGFTQVELPVVIGILALLAAVGLPSVDSARRDTKSARARKGGQDAVAGLTARGACCRPECASGGQCGGPFLTCHGNQSCLCFQTFEGGTVCTTDHFCEDLRSCPNGTPSCPPGQVCTVGTCCPQGPVCAPLDCPTAAAGSQPIEAAPHDPADGRTMSGGMVSISGGAGGECFVLDPETCRSIGGVYLGDNTVCTPTSCQPSTEACCLPLGLCRDTFPDDCRQAGGVPQGADTRNARAMAIETALTMPVVSNRAPNAGRATIGSICRPVPPVGRGSILCPPEQ